MVSYEELLKRGRKALPESALKKERFEIPTVKGHYQGNKTVISNFYQIVSTLHRDAAQLVKFLSKELATPAELTKSALIFGTRIVPSRINEKIAAYTKEFVLCRECGKPDTKLIKEDKLLFIKCLACGAKHVVKSKI